MPPNIEFYVTLFGFLVSAAWAYHRYIDGKLDKSSRACKEEVESVQKNLTELRASAVTRAEYDKDFKNLQDEIRGLRNDITKLAENMTSRLDSIVERLLDRR